MTIRFAQLNELEIIRQIAFKTWPVAYRDILSVKQLQYMLDWMYNIETLENNVTQLQHQFLIAFDDNQAPVGFASYSKTTEESDTFKLHKLYILPEEQGKKYGINLLNFVYNQIDKSTLLVNVNRANKAVSFYLNQGFAIVETVDVNIGGGYFMNDYVMEKRLNC